MLRKLIINFSLLIFSLLLVLGGVWAFLFREQMFGAGVAWNDVSAFLVRDVVFMFVVIFVLVIVAVLCILIFTDEIKLRLSELEGKLKEDENVFEEKDKLVEERKSIYEEREKLSYILSNIRDGVILLNRKREVVLLNKAAEEMVGKNQVEAAGKGVGDVFKIFEGDREIRADEYLLDDTFLKKNLRLESASATAKLVDFVGVRLALIHVQDLGYMVVFHELVGESEVEEKQFGLISAFASELRRPLELAGTENGAGGILQLSILMENLSTMSFLTRGLALRKGATHFVGASSKRRLESGNATVSVGVVDLVVVISEIVKVVESLASEKQIAVEIDIPKDLVSHKGTSFSPQGSYPLRGVVEASCRVKGDESRIRQVVLNLLINAIKYTKSGGKVIVSLSGSGDVFILRVQDTGVGMTGEDLKHLFEKFFVGENVSSEEKGIGIGLYVCKGLVDLMGGKIWIDSVEGRGTVVNVSLAKAD